MYYDTSEYYSYAMDILATYVTWSKTYLYGIKILL